jgi:hypothetical protein
MLWGSALFVKLQSHPATNPRDEKSFETFISVYAGYNAVRILGNTWGWGKLLTSAGALLYLGTLLVDKSIN